MAMSNSDSKKRKGTDESPVSSKKLKDEDSELESLFAKTAASRQEFATSVAKSGVNDKRVRLMTKTTKNAKESATGGVVYWMQRDQRVQDNWAMLRAQEMALKLERPLHVVVGLVPNKLHLTNKRMSSFQLEGLKEVETECRRLGLDFHLLVGTADDMPNVVKFAAKDVDAAAVVTDFAPLRHPLKWLKSVAAKLDERDIPLWQVDAHNVVPCWLAAEKLQVGARVIRPRITRQLPEFLVPFPPVTSHPFPASKVPDLIDWENVAKTIDEAGLDGSVQPVTWARGGAVAGFETLDKFLKKNLKYFGSQRNDPNKACLSNVSPWVTFGHISMQRCILEANKLKSKFSEGVAAFVEEAVIRKELSDNFCFYQPKYDSMEGAANWARESLSLHADDKRDYVYKLKAFQASQTHDPLWNAAQIQLVKEGKIHGFLRMYWAKKILEWAATPEEALQIAIYLNDKYSLDGRCPNGFVGCMWSIVGTHDQGWKERPVFGKIRYMNYAGCKRKFDVPAFEQKYGGKVNHMKSQKKK